MEEEEWRPIKGWPYEVSNLGRVRRAIAGHRTFAGRVLKLNCCGYYPIVMLNDHGRRGVFPIHALVCRAFHGEKPFESSQVAHGNGDPYDNRAVNLRWATAKENAKDRDIHGRTSRGVKHWLATPERETKIREMIRLLGIGLSERKICGKLGIHRSLIQRFKRGEAGQWTLPS